MTNQQIVRACSGMKKDERRQFIMDDGSTPSSIALTILLNETYPYNYLAVNVTSKSKGQVVVVCLISDES